jgi:hypothetical protein
VIWSVAGLVLAASVAVAAWRCSRSRGGFFAREVYAMDAATHRRYALVSLLFAAFFAVTYARGLASAGIAGLALYALVAVFYAASFAQGAHDE